MRKLHMFQLSRLLWERGWEFSGGEFSRGEFDEWEFSGWEPSRRGIYLEPVLITERKNFISIFLGANMRSK